MNYTVYDVTEHSPSLAERDIIWSVLLFGDKVEITSNMALAFLVYGDFPHYTEQQKFDAYEFFKPMIQSVTTWEIFDSAIKHILQQRKKKNKTGLEVKDLAGREVWLRKTEKWFETSLRDNLAKYNYEEIVPLTLHYLDKEEPDIKMTAPVPFIDTDSESRALEHFIRIAANALAQQDNMMVFDERIMPFIINHTIKGYGGQPSDNSKAVVFSEKVFTMPLCYMLKSNDIQAARNEMKLPFQGFHKCIHRISTGEEELKSGMEKLRSLLPELQNKIENSNFVKSVRNQQAEIPYVDMHLAFTSNKGILNILKQLGMLNEEQVLQASDIVLKESNLDRLRPFMYITHNALVK